MLAVKNSNESVSLVDLQNLFWEINFQHFGGILPPIEVQYSSRLRTTGGRYFKKPKRFIQINTKYLKLPNSYEEIKDTLGHEMVHYWLDFLGRPCGHTPEFRKKLKQCGFSRYSRISNPLKKNHYVYHCPSCKLEYRRKKKGLWSCGPCSGKRFNPAFILQLSVQKEP